MIEEFLGRAAPEQRLELAPILLPIDIEYRLKRFGKLGAEEYEGLTADEMSLANQLIDEHHTNEDATNDLK